MAYTLDQSFGTFNVVNQHTVHSESCCALRLRYTDLVVSIEVAVEVCCCCDNCVHKKHLTSTLYVFFWVIPRRLNFICRRFRTLCLFHLHRQVGVE